MKLGLVIPIFNRPEYVAQCFRSIQDAFIPEGTLVVLVNDASTNPETIDLFNAFNLQNAFIYKITNKQNQGIKKSLIIGFNKCFESGCHKVMNLDSDAIVKPNFIEVLGKLKQAHPDNIVSGFNSVNKNRDGSLRNPIIEEHEDYFLKKHANGINMHFMKEEYEQIILPSLSRPVGNWDFDSTRQMPFVISKPSVVQHIGMSSSLGHHEEPDIASDFKTLFLPKVTLFGLDTKNAHLLHKAAEISQRDIEFGAVKLVTDPIVHSKEQYSHFCIKKLNDYFDTEHVLVIQADGFVLNSSAWNESWLQYDYIGATWWYKDNMNVGNGGFSLRSKKLQEILATDEYITSFHPEDDVICRKYRPYLEKQHGIKFAPEEVANKFSIEAYNTPRPQNQYNGQFGFHGRYVDFNGSMMKSIVQHIYSPAQGYINPAKSMIDANGKIRTR